METSDPDPIVVLRAVEADGAGISAARSARLSQALPFVARATAPYGWDTAELTKLVQAHGAQTSGRLNLARIAGPEGDRRRAITLLLRWAPERDREPVSATFTPPKDTAAGEVRLAGPLPAVLFCVCARAKSIGAWDPELATWIERVASAGAPATHAWSGMCTIDIGHAP